MSEKKTTAKVINFAPLVVPQSMIQAVAGVSKTMALEMEKKGTFPKRRQIPGQKRNGWALSDLKRWADGLPHLGENEHDISAAR